jgi:hypothetical protein
MMALNQWLFKTHPYKVPVAESHQAHRQRVTKLFKARWRCATRETEALVVDSQAFVENIKGELVAQLRSHLDLCT